MFDIEADIERLRSEVLPTRSSRPPSEVLKTSTGHSTGWLVGRVSAHAFLRQFLVESELERVSLLCLLARPDVIEVWEQPKAVSYRDGEGRPHEHTFDFLVTTQDERRVATMVKPAERASRPSFLQLKKLLEEQTPRSFATHIMVLTERSFHDVEKENAKLMHICRSEIDLDADAVVWRLASRLSDSVTLEEVTNRAELGGRGFRAAVRAIRDGILRLPTLQELNFNTVVVKG